jgi:hypothetical protein
LGSAAAAQNTAFLSKVVLFGVPRCRPPRRSPGLDPRGIFLVCYFAIFLRAAEARGIYQSLTSFARPDAQVFKIPAADLAQQWLLLRY